MLNGIERLRTDKICPLRESMVTYRSKGAFDYLEVLRSIPAEHLESWSETTLINPASWVWERAQLRV